MLRLVISWVRLSKMGFVRMFLMALTDCTGLRNRAGKSVPRKGQERVYTANIKAESKDPGKGLCAGL